MSGRDPYPSPKFENDFTLSGFRPPERKTYDEPCHITQTEDPWSHLHSTPTQASTRRSVEYCEHQAPNKSLDLALSSIYDHHKDAFCNKSQILCQKETVSEDHRKRENLEKGNMSCSTQTQVWVEPKKCSIPPNYIHKAVV